MNALDSCLRAFAIATVLTTSAFAVTVVECVDAEGHSSFRDKCPTGMTKTGERKLHGVGTTSPSAVALVAQENPVTLYTVPQCDVCDLVRNHLNERAIPYTEKDVSADAVLQKELMDAAGSVTVPTVLLGKEVFKGYTREALEEGLTTAGYP